MTFYRKRLKILVEWDVEIQRSKIIKNLYIIEDSSMLKMYLYLRFHELWHQLLCFLPKPFSLKFLENNFQTIIHLVFIDQWNEVFTYIVIWVEKYDVMS